ncbi:hypothetical protein FGO68_gene5906 [Halteria grandinella]|uniref:Uncharacterized protein n=1 Tax=Halteria grandinella TaxID=5974 RepID=A0A8J8NL51_HALGN|nr:hypothetical protein FGO68_gene5906 [Halteria grandinella]
MCFKETTLQSFIVSFVICHIIFKQIQSSLEAKILALNLIYAIVIAFIVLFFDFIQELKNLITSQQDQKFLGLPIKLFTALFLTIFWERLQKGISLVKNRINSFRHWN